MAYAGLATGAGAATGLETLFTRMREEEELRQRAAAGQTIATHYRNADALAGRTQDRLDKTADINNEMLRSKADIVREITGLLRDTDNVGDGGGDGMGDGPRSTEPAAREVSGFARLNTPEGRAKLEMGGFHPNEMFGAVRAPRTENLTSEDEYLDAYAKGLGKPDRSGLTDAEIRNGKRKMAQATHIDSPVPVITVDQGGNPTTRFVDKREGASYARPAPESIRNRADNARRVVGHIDDMVIEAEQLDKAGLMGPIAGRWTDFAANKWGSADDIGQLLGRPVTPQEEQLISEFKADVGLLKSGMAMVHGGARGGGSIEMNKRFDNYMNTNHMDINHFKGATRSFQKWLNKYADLTPADAPTDKKDEGAAGDDLYQQYLKRSAKPGGK